MSDPKYLTDEGADATDFERELLVAGQEVGLSSQEKQAIWASVALAAVPGAAVAPVAPASIAPSVAASKVGLGVAPWLKGMIVLAALSGVGAGVYGLEHARAKAPTVHGASAAELVSAHSVAAPPSSANTPADEPAAARAVDPASAVVPGATDAPSAASAGRDLAPAESRSALRDESLAVLDIRRSLRAGDASGALRLLEQARQRFPHGALSQEREALNLEALAKSGQTSAAARQAQAFLRAHPKSPYAADVQSLTSH